MLLRARSFNTKGIVPPHYRQFLPSIGSFNHVQQQTPFFAQKNRHTNHKYGPTPAFYSTDHLGRYRPLSYTDIFPKYRGDRADATLTIQYDDPAYLTASNGMVLSPEQVQKKPTVRIHTDNQVKPSKRYFSILMVDPDVPSRDNRELAEWIHWAVINIPNREGQGRSNEGKEIVEYIGAASQKDTGFHRYIFCIFTHNSMITFRDDEPTKFPISIKQLKERERFCAQKFAESYDLGMPIIMDSFQAEWSEYVPKLYPHLKLGCS